MTCMQHYVNTHINGDEDVPGQWQLPLSKDRKTVAPVIMTNTLASVFVETLDKLIHRILAEDEDVYATK